MPNPVNAVKGQQWDLCARCGRLFPMSQLTMQDGVPLCTQRCCFDNKTVEKREQVIAHVLGTAVDLEGADTRWVDMAFFETTEEESS